MKRGDTLIRLRRFRVDEMKRRMATLDGMKADAERKLSDSRGTASPVSASAPVIPTLVASRFPSFLALYRNPPRKSARHAQGDRARACHRPGRSQRRVPGPEEPGVCDRTAGQACAGNRSPAFPVAPREMALVRHLRKHAMRGRPRAYRRRHRSTRTRCYRTHRAGPPSVPDTACPMVR